MSSLTLDVKNIRFGQIEENNLHWCKVGGFTAEHENTRGFFGQRFAEFSVRADVAQSLSSQLKELVPAVIEFETGIKMEQGKPLYCITGLVGAVGK